MNDMRLENWLTELMARYPDKNIRFVFEKGYPVAQLDLALWLNNPARLDNKYDPVRAAKYRLLMERGVDFPAIAVFSDRSPASGRHRVGGHSDAMAGPHSKKVLPLDAYVLYVDDPLIRELILRTINSIEGFGNPDEHELPHIAEILRNHPTVTQAELAEWFPGMTQHRISEYTRLRDYERRADALGCLVEWMKLSQTHQLKLGKLSNDVLWVPAVMTLANTGTNGVAADKLIAAISRPRSEKDALAQIASVQREYDVRAAATRSKGKLKLRGDKRNAIHLKWLKKIIQLRNFMPNWNVEELKLYNIEFTQIPADLATIKELQSQLDDAMIVLESRLEQRRDEEARRASGKSAPPTPPTPLA